VSTLVFPADNLQSARLERSAESRSRCVPAVTACFPVPIGIRKGWLMNVSTTARHYDLAPGLKDYAEEKVLHLKHYFDQIVTANIVFSLEKYRYRFEVAIHVNGRDFVGVEESDDMYTSVDRCVEKLERQLRRHKGKIKRRKQQQSVSDLTTRPAPEADEPGEEEAAS